MIRLLLTMLFLPLTGALIPLSAREINSRIAEELTLRYYLEKQWDSVILIGKEALKYKIDYFHLRLRLGIAYYEKNKFIPSSLHLERAHQFNSSDTLTLHYLYYAYLFSNRPVDAAKVLKQQQRKRPEGRILTREILMPSLHMEGGYTFSTLDKLQENPDLAGADSIYGEADVYGNNSIISGGFSLNPFPWMRIDLSYTRLDFTKHKYFQYGVIEDHLQTIADSSWGKMYIWSFPRMVYDTSFTYRVSQHEFHAGVTLSAAGWKINPAFHLVKVGYPVIDARFFSEVVHDTGYYVSYDSSWHTFPFRRTGYTFSRQDTSFTNYVVSLSLSRNYGILVPGLSASWSNLNGKTQYQAGFSLTFYPLGNLNLYTTTGLTGFFEEDQQRLLCSQVAGGRITPWLWAEADVMYGDFTNANIANGMIVYNNTGKIGYRVGSGLLFLITEKIRISLMYRFFRKAYQRYYFTPVTLQGGDDAYELQTENIPFQTHSMIGGFIWKL